MDKHTTKEIDLDTRDLFGFELLDRDTFEGTPEAIAEAFSKIGTETPPPK